MVYTRMINGSMPISSTIPESSEFILISELGVLIAFCNSTRSCTSQHLSKFISYSSLSSS